MYYFASDVHLGAGDELTSRRTEQRFVAWLDMVAKDAEEIFLVGDIFDFWFEYNYVIPKGFVRALGKLAELDDYVIEHFRLAFGNRIVKQLKEFVPAYVGCGGTEIDGIDFVLAKKVFRKFESLNLSFIRDEIDGLITYLNKHFGKANMNECKEYLQLLKRLM